MPLHPEEMADLPQSARLEVGRAWNDFVRWQRSAIAAREARNSMYNRLISLRGGYGLSCAKIARILGWEVTRVKRYTASYADPEFGQGRRAKVKARPDRVAGEAPAPGSEPSLARMRNKAREEIGD